MDSSTGVPPKYLPGSLFALFVLFLVHKKRRPKSPLLLIDDLLFATGVNVKYWGFI